MRAMGGGGSSSGGGERNPLAQKGFSVDAKDADKVI